MKLNENLKVGYFCTKPYYNFVEIKCINMKKSKSIFQMMLGCTLTSALNIK